MSKFEEARDDEIDINEAVPPDDAFVEQVEAALQSAGIATLNGELTESSDAEEPFDDQQMMALDEKLAAAFKQHTAQRQMKKGTLHA